VHVRACVGIRFADSEPRQETENAKRGGSVKARTFSERGKIRQL